MKNMHRFYFTNLKHPVKRDTEPEEIKSFNKITIIVLDSLASHIMLLTFDGETKK